MAKFRKKPVVIDAWQIVAGIQDAPELATYVLDETISHQSDGSILIQTLEGVMRGNPGDWLIRGVKGELYPCKDDIFRQTYDVEVLSRQ